MGNIIKGAERREEIKKCFVNIPNNLNPEERKMEIIKHILQHHIKDEKGFEIYMDIKFLAFPELTNFDKPIVLRKPSGNEQLNQ